MKPLFAVLNNHYPRSQEREVLYTGLGWPDLIAHPGYRDTCAIRMSVGLAAAGVPLHDGTMRAKAGPLKDKRIVHRHRDLSNLLKRMWGTPEIYKGEQAARDGIGKRRGVVSFFRIEGGDGGHIDLIWPGVNGFAVCARSCFFSAREIWFWPLK
jgi:Type VI secretion system (T6SS), amidase effector protein 4